MAGENSGRIAIDWRDRLAGEVAVAWIRQIDGGRSAAHIIDRRFDLGHTHTGSRGGRTAQLVLQGRVADVCFVISCQRKTGETQGCQCSDNCDEGALDWRVYG